MKKLSKEKNPVMVAAGKKAAATRKKNKKIADLEQEIQLAAYRYSKQLISMGHSNFKHRHKYYLNEAKNNLSMLFEELQRAAA